MSDIPYDAILILRLLLMRDQRPEDWRTFRLLQCSLDEWRKMHPWEENQEEKVTIIREKLKLNKFSREDILEVEYSFMHFTSQRNLCICSFFSAVVDMLIFQVIAICCTNTFSKYLDPNSEGEADAPDQVLGTKVSRQ